MVKEPVLSDQCGLRHCTPNISAEDEVVNTNSDGKDDEYSHASGRLGVWVVRATGVP